MLEYFPATCCEFSGSVQPSVSSVLFGGLEPQPFMRSSLVSFNLSVVNMNIDEFSGELESVSATATATGHRGHGGSGW